MGKLSRRGFLATIGGAVGLLVSSFAGKTKEPAGRLVWVVNQAHSSLTGAWAGLVAYGTLDPPGRLQEPRVASFWGEGAHDLLTRLQRAHAAGYRPVNPGFTTPGWFIVTTGDGGPEAVRWTKWDAP